MKIIITSSFFAGSGLVDERTGMQIQNLLICIEMLLASLLHYYIFPHREWAENYKRDRQKQTGVPDTLAFRDFVSPSPLLLCGACLLLVGDSSSSLSRCRTCAK